MCSRQRTCQKKRNTWKTVWNTNFTWKGSSQFPEISQLFWHGICSALEYGQEIARIIDYKTMSTGFLDFQKLKVIKGDQWWSAKECQWFLRIWRVVDFTHVRFHPVTLWAAPFEFTVVLRITVWVYESSISHLVTWYFGANADLARNYMALQEHSHIVTSENGVKPCITIV